MSAKELIESIPFVGDAIGFVSDLLGGSASAKDIAKENAKNRKWQEQMRGTQYQAAVKDMKAAGLNPAMLYGHGQLSASVGQPYIQSETSAKQRARELALDRIPRAFQLMQLKQMQASIADTNSAKALKDSQKESTDQARFFELQDMMGWSDEGEGRSDMLRRGRMQARQLEAVIAREVASAKGIDQSAAESVVRAAVLDIQKQIEEKKLPRADAEAALWKRLGEAGAIPGWLKDVLPLLLALIKD